VEILVGESVFLYIWCGNGIPHLFFSNTPLPANNNYWTKVQLSTKSVSNIFFSTCCTAFLKLRYRDIVAFRTKNWMDENLLIG